MKKGDRVQLKSGGPIMTLKEFRDNKVRCQWFEGDKLKEGDFSIESLELYSDPTVNGQQDY